VFEAQAGISIAPTEPILFLHRRRARNGIERLVVVTRYLQPAQYSSMIVPWHEYSLSSATFRKPAEIDSSRTGSLPSARLEDLAEYGTSLTFYAGQVDPADDSHFTIDYDIDSNRGVIDGYLNEDLTTTIAIRSGPGKRLSAK
jgi:hypothetical protein